MARTVSWQSDLGKIHRSVSESPRALWHREDLEKLFDLEERASRQLMTLMRRTATGSIHVVEREALLEFLAGAIDTDDLSGYLAALRKSPPPVARRKLKLRLPETFEPGNMRSLERRNVWLERGKLSIDFDTLDDLAGKLMQLFQVLEDPAFERRWCAPPKPVEKTQEELLELADRELILVGTKALHKVECLAETMRLSDTDPDFTATSMPLAATFRAEASKLIDELERLEATPGGVACRLRERLASFALPAAEPYPETYEQGLNSPPAADPPPQATV